jgi:ribose 5-phosphate isomerase B
VVANLGRVKVAFGTDEVTPVTEELRGYLAEVGHEVTVVGDGMRWADVGRLVGEAVSSGRADVGIVFCFTGTGVSMAANKVPGVRAALCVDAETARGARRWNDANVLALSLRLTTGELAREIVEAFFASAPDESEADPVARLV